MSSSGSEVEALIAQLEAVRDEPLALSHAVISGIAGKAVVALEELVSAPTEATFTAKEVIGIANDTSDSQGNLYRLDFISRIEHEAVPAGPWEPCNE